MIYNEEFVEFFNSQLEKMGTTIKSIPDIYFTISKIISYFIEFTCQFFMLQIILQFFCARKFCIRIIVVAVVYIFQKLFVHVLLL